jgi:hypothetical protein
VVFLWWYSDVKWRYSGVTMVVLWVTVVLRCTPLAMVVCESVPTHESGYSMPYSVSAVLVQFQHSVSTVSVQCQYSVSTMLVQCHYSVSVV